MPYIKKNHTTGLSWNPRGGDAKPAAAGAAAPAASAPAAAAPKAAPAAAAAPVKGAALFSELNKGGDITSGLKKVLKRVHFTCLFTIFFFFFLFERLLAARPTRTRRSAERSRRRKPRSYHIRLFLSCFFKSLLEKVVSAAKPAKPARCELNGTKWSVEWQVNAAAPVVVKSTAKNQTVYIYKCENCVIIIEGETDDFESVMFFS